MTRKGGEKTEAGGEFTQQGCGVQGQLANRLIPPHPVFSGLQPPPKMSVAATWHRGCHAHAGMFWRQSGTAGAMPTLAVGMLWRQSGEGPKNP